MKRYVKASELHGEQLANYIRKVQKAVDIDTPDYVLGIEYDMNSDDELIVTVSFDNGDSHTFKFESWRFTQSLAYIGEDADIILNAIRHYAKENDIDDDVQDWELVTWKSVEDFDGFTTDYSLWYNSAEDYYVCIFGDRDLYTPETADFDAEFETEREAYEWFDSYGEDDIVEESTRISSSEESDEFVDMGTGLNYWYFTTHGVMPGSVPKGLNIIKIVDKPEGTYFLTDRVLTTKSLKHYDIKERAPKGVTAHFDPLEDMDAADVIGPLNPGDKFKNRAGVVITITDPTRDGRVQYNIGQDCGVGPERSVQKMLYRNNYIRI